MALVGNFVVAVGGWSDRREHGCLLGVISEVATDQTIVKRPSDRGSKLRVNRLSVVTFYTNSF
jgi:hypothetical protein